jgi:predicted transport protein
MSNFTRSERISLKLHPDLNEYWVQGLIADDPGILGLGDLVLRDRERIQPRAGRLDLLLQDVEAKRRYEVEIQLGPTDEAHIIRTIEYWDIERKRYPQVDEDEDAEAAPTDRAYWEKKGTKATVQLADELLGVAHEIDPSLELKYNKFYIGLSKGGKPFNFVQFRPRKNTITLEINLPRSEDIDAKIDQSGLETFGLHPVWLTPA